MGFKKRLIKSTIKILAVSPGFLIGSLFVLGVTSARAEAVLNTLWKATLPEHPLKAWSVAEIQALKNDSSREADPANGNVKTWKGPLMSLVVEKTIEALPGDQKAQVDLIVLKTATGEQIRIPRWLVTKYPVLLVPKDDSFRLVLPWTSKPKIKEEGLPLTRYQLSNITQVVLASYQQEFGSLYLKKRTDPLALRGEKLLVQNCTTCHQMGIENQARKVTTSGHPVAKEAPKLENRDLRALTFYLDQLKIENPDTTAKN